MGNASRIPRIFDRKGKFDTYVINNQRAEEWMSLQQYASARRKVLGQMSRYDNDNLSLFKPIEKISNSYALPAGEDGYLMVTSFIKKLIGLTQKVSLETYMNKNDVNFVHIHYLLMDPVTKEFFESLPAEDWYASQD